MRTLFLFVSLLIFSNCSFDNKTGIWKNNNNQVLKEDNIFKGFETLFTEQKPFNLIIKPDENFKISISKGKNNNQWLDEYYQDTNNLENFTYKDLNERIFKSKKLSSYKTRGNILFDSENLITTDNRGNIIVYSVYEKKIIYKFNFYKKKYKKNKKTLYSIIEKNIMYVSDNLGYLYALDYINQKVVWAKNYKVPFRSNLKILDNTLFLADENNTLYIVNKSNGDKIRFIPTEETTLKNSFVNSLATNGKSVFFLNTYGSLYSINSKTLNINWFLSLNETLDLNPDNLFFSNPIVINDNKIIISTNPNLFILNANNGATLNKSPITFFKRPIISANYLFGITNTKLLVCIDLISGDVKYSLNINDEIADFYKTKKKKIIIKSFSIINDYLYVFLENSFLIKFNTNGKIENINKLPESVNSSKIFIDQSILFLNNKNKLIIVN